MHLRVNSYESEWTDSAVRRLMREAGDQPNLIHLSRADVTSYRQERVLAATMRADEFERRCQSCCSGRTSPACTAPWTGTT